jgi:hypothetical protein
MGFESIQSKMDQEDANMTETIIKPHEGPDGSMKVIVTRNGPYKHGLLWVRGGIPVVSADGKPYTVRNRLTLCRCGKSRNKPFCDGSHVQF